MPNLSFKKGIIHIGIIVFGLLALTIFASISISAKHGISGRPLSSWLCNSFPNSSACQEGQQRPSPQPRVAPGGSFPYVVQADTGWTAPGNATINGNVYSNTNIEIPRNKDQESDSNEQEAQKQRCDRNSTTTISGDVWTVGRIDCAIKVNGNRYENQPPKPLPSVNIEYFKAQAAGGGTLKQPQFKLEDGKNKISLGPAKIEGDLRLHGAGIYSYQNLVNITGPVHVTGNLLIENVTMVPDSSLGSKGAVIVVDGKINIEHGGDIRTTSSTPKGFVMLVSTSSNPSRPVQSCAIRATPESTQ